MSGMTPAEYAAWQESIGRGVVVLCPWCYDWEDVEDGFFDERGNFWCCWGCESMPSHRGEPGPWGIE